MPIITNKDINVNGTEYAAGTDLETEGVDATVCASLIDQGVASVVPGAAEETPQPEEGSEESA